ncbi:MAG: hypothetical protein R3A13_00045 [Bdellovibrionota bacterium]
MKVIWTFLLIFFLSNFAIAQGADLSDPKILALLANEVGLDLNGFHMRRFRANPYPSPDPNAIYKLSPSVKKHLRFNKGIVIPPENELKTANFAKILKDIKVDPNLDLDSISPPLRDLTDDLKNIPRILPCIGSSTKVADVARFTKGKADGGSFDWLFLRASAPEQDYSKIFGKSVAVLRVSDSKATGETLTAASLSVNCLPTRFRGTKTHLYKHEGLDAIKNYDGNLNGSGKLHNEVSKEKNKFF